MHPPDWNLFIETASATAVAARLEPYTIATLTNTGCQPKKARGDRDEKNRRPVDAWVSIWFQTDGDAHYDLGLIVDETHDPITEFFGYENGHRVCH